MSTMTTPITLRELDSLFTDGIQMFDWEDGRDLTTHRLQKGAEGRSNVISTFRFQVFNGGYRVLRFYGLATDEHLAVVRAYGKATGERIEYLATSWGKPLKKLSGLDWARIS